MPPEDQMSNGEIGRHLGRIEATLSSGFAEIKSDLDKYVLKSVHEAEMRTVKGQIHEVTRDITEAQVRQRWSIGIAVTALVGFAGVALALINIITT